MIAHSEHSLTVRFNPALFGATEPAQLIKPRKSRVGNISAQHIEHMEMLAALLLKIAAVYNLPAEEINPLTVFRSFIRNDFTCNITGIQHSEQTPLGLRFLMPIESGGCIRPNNITPHYDPIIQPWEYMTESGAIIRLTESDERPSHFPPPQTFTIYRLVNTVTGNCYVGCTSVKPKKRKGGHFNKLENGTHSNQKLQKSYMKFGRKAFEFEVLETGISSEECAAAREEFWIEFYDSYSDGFNATPTGRPFSEMKAATRFDLSAYGRKQG